MAAALLAGLITALLCLPLMKQKKRRPMREWGWREWWWVVGVFVALVAVIAATLSMR
ncbi:MAG TPA: hypothetical protein VGK78_00715 [Nocardioides sp.]|uniref:hypothetical protein n=1 Tax=Nocardioides sp. TaxID=35761 RepID=UPI002F4275FB